MTLFLRGFLQVVFVAMNVKFVARGLWVPMFLSAWMVSALWFTNVGRAVDDRSFRGLCWYATGAAFATVVGAWIGGLL